MINKFKFFLISHRIDLFLCLILILAGLKYSFGLESVIDIGLHDESFYLGGGVDILSRGLPSPDWGPLYSLWYYLVSFFIKSNSELYYFNYYVQIIFLPFLLFLFLRVKKVSVHYSLFFSFLFLISERCKTTTSAKRITQYPKNDKS